MKSLSPVILDICEAFVGMHLLERSMLHNTVHLFRGLTSTQKVCNFSHLRVQILMQVLVCVEEHIRLLPHCPPREYVLPVRAVWHLVRQEELEEPSKGALKCIQLILPLEVVPRPHRVPRVPHKIYDFSLANHLGRKQPGGVVPFDMTWISCAIQLSEFVYTRIHQARPS